MIALPYFIVLVGLVVLKFLFNSQKRLKNFPPGPLGLPIVGNIFQLKPNGFAAFSKLRKQYGDIFSLDLGNLRAVVVNDYKLVKEVFVRPEFFARPFSRLSFHSNGGVQSGFGFSEGRVWSEQRRFLSKNLRDFGFGTKSIDARLQQDVMEAITDLKSKIGVPINFHDEIFPAQFNTVWEITTGESFTKTNAEHIKLHQLLSEYLRNGKTYFTSVRFPWLKYLKLAKERLFLKNASAINDIIRAKVKEHKESYNMDVTRDVIDCYLRKIQETTDPESSFYMSKGESNMIYSLLDMVLFGSETCCVALSWIAHTMAHFPEKQDKLYEEIKSVVGENNTPSLMDRTRMPYSQAVLMEVLRFTKFVPQTSRRALEDVVLAGYNIPKGTAIYTNFTEIMNDPNVWGDPNTFRPERFLSENGQDIIQHEAFVMFSVGKRSCPGEAFAKDQLFLFMTNLFQHFKVELDKTSPFTFEGHDGILTMYPKNDSIILHNRC